MKKLLGLEITREDKELVEKIKNSPYKINVHHDSFPGGWRIEIPAEEIVKSKNHRKELALCEEIVKNTK